MSSVEIATETKLWRLEFRDRVAFLLVKANELLVASAEHIAAADLVLSRASQRQLHQNKRDGTNTAYAPDECNPTIEEINGWTAEIDRLSPLLAKVDDSIEPFCVELKQLLDAVPLNLDHLRNIRTELERLALLSRERPRGLHNLRGSFADLAIIRGRLLELLDALPDSRRADVVTLTAPTGTTWADVDIQFLSDHRIRLTIHQESSVLSYAEAGFCNKKSNNPNNAWCLLRVLAEKGGKIVPSSNPDPKVVKTIQAMRKLLKRLAQLKDDPFWPYKKVGGYESRFRVSFKQSHQI